MKREPLSRRLARFTSVDRNSGCWVWTGAKFGGGYGQFRMTDLARGIRTNAGAHRVAWELVNGPVPDGLVLDHVCRNRLCINPDHLRPLTNRDNVLCGVSIIARHAAATHCKRGHPFDALNTKTVTRPDGGTYRLCRACLNRRRVTPDSQKGVPLP